MKTVLEIPNYPLLGNKEDPFKLLMAWRKDLNDKYIEKDRLPEYPLRTLATRESQNFIRALIADCEEEIFEAYDDLESIAKMVEANAPKSEILPVLEAYNQELADITHFVLEILVYLNIDYPDIDAYYGVLLKENNIQELYSSTSLLTNALSYANYINIQQGYKIQAIRMSNYNVMPDSSVTNIFQTAGRSISVSNLAEYRELLFGCIRYLNKVRSLMKNKYWKDDVETQPNMELIHKYAMEAFLHLISYLDLTGANENSILQTYYKKYQVNLDRLQNGW